MWCRWATGVTGGGIITTAGIGGIIIGAIGIAITTGPVQASIFTSAHRAITRPQPITMLGHAMWRRVIGLRGRMWNGAMRATGRIGPGTTPTSPIMARAVSACLRTTEPPRQQHQKETARKSAPFSLDRERRHARCGNPQARKSVEQAVGSGLVLFFVHELVFRNHPRRVSAQAKKPAVDFG